jgi:cytoskeletal protein CcmA (bactofilin family)
MFNKSKTNTINPLNVAPSQEVAQPTVEEVTVEEVQNNETAAPAAPVQKPSSMMDMISTAATKPSILSEGFSFRGEIAAKGAIHVEGALNGQIQVDELTIGARGQVEGVVTCSNLHIKGKFSGTATCNELIVTSSATVDGHVVYKTLSVQKGASIKGELLLVK